MHDEQERATASTSSPARATIGLADERIRQFAEHSSSAIVITDLAAGTIDYVSPAARRLWAACPRFATSADWIASVHPEDRPEAIERRALAAAGAPQELRYRIVGNDGQVARQVRETCFAMPATSGEGPGAIGGIVEDVSIRVPVYVVSTSDTRRRDLMAVLGGAANRLKAFQMYSDYMDVAEVLSPGCVVIDVRATPPSHDDLMRLLAIRPDDLQVVVVGDPATAPGDIIAALRAGAADVLVAPELDAPLLCAVDKACGVLAHAFPVERDAGHAASHRLAALSRREREVFLGLVQGGTNKSIARTLGLSPRTVEVHRAHLMQRLSLRSLTELLHLAHEAGIRTRH